jgi:hypothetical protein
MRALTLTQPWAALVASGIKLIENRSQSTIKRADFSVPFAIHAGKQISQPVYDTIARIDPRCDVHTVAADTPWLKMSRVTSAIVGIATVERAVLLRGDGQAIDSLMFDVVDLGDQRRWFFGRFGYVLRDVRALAEPVPCRGWQGFWRLPTDVEANVLRQIETKR